jgi:xylan 1,4-beta-xylosidase
MFAQLGPDRVQATSDAQVALDAVIAEGVRASADVGVLATRDEHGRLAILLWHYHDDDLPGADAAVTLDIRGLGRAQVKSATLWRVDGANANAFAAWKAMGSPQSPNATQYAQLEKASELVPQPLQIVAKRGSVSLPLTLPRQGVALLVAEPR